MSVLERPTATPATPAAPGRQPWSLRLVRRMAGRAEQAPVEPPSGAGSSRRGFLVRSAVVGSALATRPLDWVLRPGTAYASVCGTGTGCDGGWTAFCCTVTGGSNLCPADSFIAGWWKSDNSAFCCGTARYIIDCNATCPRQCTCRCATGTCDDRRVCCNQFRYGQCHQEIACYGPVVCRVVTCTPPWQYDPSCTTTVATDNRTSSHSAPCLPGNCPSAIERLWFYDTGGPGGVLGNPVGPEGPTGDGRGTTRLYERGRITSTPQTGTHEVHGSIHARWAALGGHTGPIGYPITNELGVGDGRGRRNLFERGAIVWSSATGAWELRDDVLSAVDVAGGIRGQMGYPIGPDVVDEEDRRVQRFERGTVAAAPGRAPFAVFGPIHGAWVAEGAERSMGCPIATQTTSGGFERATFQHGTIVRDLASGSITVTSSSSRWGARPARGSTRG